MTSVLYDAPGPRAKRRNVIFSVVSVVVLALLLWWVYLTMDDKGQLEWALWKPFTEPEAWTTYLLPGLVDTLKAAGLAMVMALPLGAVLGIAQCPTTGGCGLRPARWWSSSGPSRCCC
ncbi:hypothetical protein SHIRM173S_10524 [Streptomyces hirsutus]